MKVELPKYRDGEFIHQFFMAYKRSMSTLKIRCEQWGSYLSSSLSGKALEVFIREISEEELCNLMMSLLSSPKALDRCRSLQRVSGGL